MSKEIVLALGGGGVRGFAHLGVLKVLTDHAIPVRAVAGSSAGALVAAAYAFGLPLDPNYFLEHVFDPRLSRSLQMGGSRLRRVARLHVRLFTALRHLSLARNDRLRDGFYRIFGDRQIEEAAVPLGIVATDLHSRERVVLKEGSVVEALLGSIAVPGVLPPVRWGPYLLVDGDVMEKVPVTAARELWGGPVVAVDVSNPSEQTIPASTLDVLIIASLASRERLKEMALQQADLVLSLQPENPIPIFDYKRAAEVYELGVRRTEALLPAIKALVTPEIPPIATQVRPRPQHRASLLRRLWYMIKPPAVSPQPSAKQI